MSLVRLSENKARTGDVVKLLPNIYKPCPQNPAINSGWECLGTIVHIYVTNFRIDSIEVAWENGSTNAYRLADLVKVTGVDEGFYVDVWTKMG